MERGKISYQTADEGIGQRKPLELRYEVPLGVSTHSNWGLKSLCKGNTHAKVHVGKHGICITVCACQRNLNDQYLIQKPCDAGSEFIAIIQFTHGQQAAQRGNMT